MHKVTLAADIEKAFLMMSMAEKDRDVLRFLWIDDIAKKEPSCVRCVESILTERHRTAPSKAVLHYTFRNSEENFTLMTLRMVLTQY